jgi:hypothetical protein
MVASQLWADAAPHYTQRRRRAGLSRVRRPVRPARSARSPEDVENVPAVVAVSVLSDLSQPLDQFVQDVVIASVRALAQFTDLAAFGQRADRGGLSLTMLAAS